MAISDKSNEVIVKMIPRWINEIQASVNAGYTLMLNTTLNSKYNIYPNLGVNKIPTLMYFGLGINGFYNVDDTNKSAPYRPSPDELDLYQPIPIRCVPIDEDLDAAERSLYRMRKEVSVNGERYYCYYLKCLKLIDNTVQLTRTNPVSHEEEPYELNASKLTPVPKVPTTSGEQEGTISEINASLRLSLDWTGKEVLEAINVLYNGDMTMAKISEYGIYSGEDQQVIGYNSSNEEITYTESIYTQIAYKCCNTGSTITSPSYNGSRIFKLTNANTLML